MTLSNDAKLVTFINVFTVEPLQRMIENVPQQCANQALLYFFLSKNSKLKTQKPGTY